MKRHDPDTNLDTEKVSRIKYVPLPSLPQLSLILFLPRLLQQFS